MSEKVILGKNDKDLICEKIKRPENYSRIFNSVMILEVMGRIRSNHTGISVLTPGFSGI